jgi:hypothetical protein
MGVILIIKVTEGKVHPTGEEEPPGVVELATAIINLLPIYF